MLFSLRCQQPPVEYGFALNKLIFSKARNNDLREYISKFRLVFLYKNCSC